MKLKSVLMAAAFVMAVGGAFASKKTHVFAGDYKSFKDSDGTCHTSTGTQSTCTGSGSTCTISNNTYYPSTDCSGTPLKFV